MDSFSSYHNGGPGRESDFQRLAQTIGTSIQKICQNVSSMQKMVNQLGTPNDTQELRHQLHQIQHYTQQLAKDTMGHLEELKNIPHPATSSEQRQWKLQKERLAEDFTRALNTFQTTQRTAAQKEKEEIRRVRASSGLGDPFGSSSRNEPLIELQDQSERRQLQIQEEIDHEALQEREQAIRQLESDIIDVNQIFKELATMVHEQGEVIDSIEANVEKTEVHVTEGATQLSKARDLQNRARKKKFILFTILFIVLVIVISILIWKLT